MKINQSFLLLLLSTITSTGSVSAFSAVSPDMTRSRLKEALCSPSGKLTLSPELIIPEPTDPTALLLKSTEVTKVSERIRTSAKANVAFIEGSIGSLRSFAAEQENARGQFPSPVPVVFTGIAPGSDDAVDLDEAADAGVSGIIVSVLNGKAISTVQDLIDQEDGSLKDQCEKALASGLQPIPEVFLVGGTQWEEEDVVKLVDVLTEKCGDAGEPVSVVLTIDAPEESDDDEEGSEDEEAKAAFLPKVPKALGKRVPIIGSVKVPAGGGRMSQYTKLMKESGFTGAYLRADCVPGFRMNPDLEAVGGFWCAAIGDLKSVKSKNFSFRSKVQLDKDVPLEWYNYQKNIMESGALGDFSGPAQDVNSDAGDYLGF
mmetsp:Transcript_37352/g.54614  ORF Transcript_37352/g.54614 Transcript_37352/m.54614 type:complete len:373 (-) Transcript_37352:41-1159(-)